MTAAGVALAAWAMAGAQDARAGDAGAQDAAALAKRYGELAATSGPDISPDGRYLVRQVAHGGRYVLRIEGVDGSNPVLWAPAEGSSLGWFDWTGDNTLLVRTTVLAAVPKRTLDPDGKRSRRYIEIFKEQRPQVITPRGEPVAKMTFRRLGAINVFQPLAAPEASRGDMPVFIGTEGAGNYGEKFGPARVSLGKNKYDFEAPPVKGSGYFGYLGSHDGGVVLAHRTELGETERTYYLRAAKRWRRLDGLDLTGLGLMGVEDEATLLVRDEAEGGLHLYDLAANAVRETLHPGPAYPIRRPSDGAVIAVSLRRGDVAFLNEAEEAVHARAEAVIGEGAYPLDASHDGRFRLYSRAADGRPVGYHVWDADEGRVVRSLSSRPSMAAAPAPTVRTVSYAARDGLRVEGFLSEAANREADAEPLPLVVMPHGGPAARDTAGFDSWREYLTTLGYAVFQPNFRGSTGYGQDFARAGYGEWGAAMQTDIVDGVAALIEAGDADPDRLAIMGGSYGGYAALMGTLDETPYRCAVSIAGRRTCSACSTRSRRGPASTTGRGTWARGSLARPSSRRARPCAARARSTCRCC